MKSPAPSLRSSEMAFSLRAGPAGLAATVLLTLSVPVQAFDYKGHALVCALAYDALTETTRQAVDQLSARSGLGKPFPQLCSWADDIRSEERWKYTGPWHYVNVARNDTDITPQHCPDQGCVLSAISEMEARLRKAPQTDWQALLFLGHFVADVHQPLHVSYGDDRGGNTFRVSWKGEPTNLHAVWDSRVPGLDADPERNRSRFQSRMTGFHAHADAGLPLVWAQESLDRTRLVYRTYEPGENLDDSRVSEDRVWLQGHMVQAAQRLADLLEDVF
ncbi:MAG TPA: endonuclease [Oceanospirillales bacterium]|nr:endonuclease [Oceanospirillaceae bacterium]HBS43178.1 endonuclease [Oceanospirillales bacterium]